MKKSNVKVTRTAQEKQASKKARRIRRKVKLTKMVDSKVRVLTKKLIEMDAGFKQMQGLFLNANMELNKLKAEQKPEITVNGENITQEKPE
jgi:hypothetical protein